MTTLRSQMDRVSRIATRIATRVATRNATRVAVAAGLLAGSASLAQAQWWPTGSNNGAPQNATLLFEWQGRVDREVQFDIGRRGVDVRGIDGDQARGRLRERSDLPRGEGRLIVQRLDGRGAVDVIRQPASTNNGTGRGYGNQQGVVRVRDSQGGADTYRIRVYWQSTGSYGSNDGTYDRNDRNDRRNGRDDDRYDNRRRRP
jgi:hypothetical protein